MIVEILKIKIIVYFQINFEEDFVELGRYTLMFKCPHQKNILGVAPLKWWCPPGVV